MIEYDGIDETPLLAACLNGDIEGVVELLEAGTDVNVQDDHGRSALHMVLDYQHLSFEDLDTRNDIIKILVKCGIDINLITRRLSPCCDELPRVCSTGSRETALHMAVYRANEWATIFLLAHGANINQRDDKGRSVMHYAMMSGSINITKCLLDRGLSFVDVDLEGSLPLHVAAANGHSMLTEYILESFVVLDCLDINLRTPLHLAVGSADLETSKLLLEMGADTRLADEDGWTVLHYACVYADYDLVKLVLKFHPDVNAQTKGNQDTPLHLIAQRAGKADILQLLLEHNAHVNIHNWFSKSPLDCAFQVKNVECISYLLDYGADIYQTNVLFGSTCNLARSAEEDEYKSIAWLILSHTYKLDALETPTKLDVSMLFSLFEIVDPDYCNKCFREVASLKLIKISEGFSLYDLLTVPFSKLVHLCKSTVNKVVANSKYELYFPVYGRMLQIKLRRAMAKVRLCHGGEMFFTKLGQYRAPSLTYDVITLITSYLSDRDLGVLADVSHFSEFNPE